MVHSSLSCVLPESVHILHVHSPLSVHWCTLPYSVCCLASVQTLYLCKLPYSVHYSESVNTLHVHNPLSVHGCTMPLSVHCPISMQTLHVYYYFSTLVHSALQCVLPVLLHILHLYYPFYVNRCTLPYSVHHPKSVNTSCALSYFCTLVHSAL